MSAETSVRLPTLPELTLVHPATSPTAIPSSDERGLATETRVAELLRSHPAVAEVHRTPKNGEEDKNMIDLFVYMAPPDSGKPVRVQVKSTNKAEHDFKIDLNARLREIGEPDRQQWQYQNRFVIINGGERKTRIAKVKRRVTDEEILSSYFSQWEQITVFERSQQGDTSSF